MKNLYLFIGIFFCIGVSYSQDTTKQIGTTNTLSAYSYLDFIKTGIDPLFWGSYDHNKFSVEARYNYDYDKNISLYFGAVLKHNDWKLRLMQGITTGNQTGISLSPTTIYDGEKIFFFTQAQVILSVSKMPTYFFHWGEIYYKPVDWFWVGLADRIYLDNQNVKDFSFGSQVSFAYKQFFLNLYYWLPTSQTENRYSILLGYERSFKRQRTKK